MEITLPKTQEVGTKVEVAQGAKDLGTMTLWVRWEEPNEAWNEIG